MKLSILALLTTLITACSSTGTPLSAMNREVDLPKFMGRWYVIASIPTIFEQDVHNAVETYSWNAEENRIDIDFRFNQGSLNGPVKKFPQKGFIFDERTKAEWRVQPLWPFRLAYLIADLAPDYSDTIIAVPNRKYVWIMARSPKISPARYQELVEKVKSLGYDTKDLRLVPHSN